MTSKGSRRRALLKRLKVLAIAFAVIYAGVLVTASVSARRFIYPGASFAHRTPSISPGNAIVLERAIEGDAPVYGWFYQPLRNLSAPLLVVFHGNGELIEDWTELVQIWNRLGYAVLLVEYRGYGNAGGTPSQDALVADALDLIDQAQRSSLTDADRLVYLGFSLGGGVAGAVARELEPDAIILHSTFTSMKNMFARYLVPGFAVPDPYDTLSWLETFEGPKLVTHGRADIIIPFWHGERLAETGAEFFGHDGGHVEALTHPGVRKATLEMLEAMLERWAEPTEPAAEADSEPAG